MNLQQVFPLTYMNNKTYNDANNKSNSSLVMRDITIPVDIDPFCRFSESLLNIIGLTIPNDIKERIETSFKETDKVEILNEIFQKDDLHDEQQNNSFKDNKNMPESLTNINKKNQKTKKRHKKKPSIPIPFYGHIEESWCNGVRKNHGLYTQCTNKQETNCQYCSVCNKQANNNASKKPNCGDIFTRKQQWTEQLTYQPDGMKREIPYGNLMEKLNISLEKANNECRLLGWGDIPNCHLETRKAKRGRPKTKIAVESDDEKTPKKRGRPKKIKKGEPTDDELIAYLLEQMS